VLFVLAQNYLQDLLKLAGRALAGVPVLVGAAATPDRWLLWLGVLFVLSVYHFPTGIVGRLRALAAIIGGQTSTRLPSAGELRSECPRRAAERRPPRHRAHPDKETSMNKRPLGTFRPSGHAAVLRRQRVRLDHRRGRLVLHPGCLRRCGLRFHRYGRRVLGAGCRATRAASPRPCSGGGSRAAGSAIAPCARDQGGPWALGEDRKGLCASRRWIERAVEDSPRRLQTDRIDLYQSHQDDADTPQQETLEAYDRLIKAGKVRAIGASNFTAARLKSALDLGRANGLPMYVSLQPPYNLYDREPFEAELQALCVAEDVGVINYYALAAGFLSGKYRSPADVRKSARGLGVTKKYLNPRGLKIPGRARCRRRPGRCHALAGGDRLADDAARHHCADRQRHQPRPIEGADRGRVAQAGCGIAGQPRCGQRVARGLSAIRDCETATPGRSRPAGPLRGGFLQARDDRPARSGSRTRAGDHSSPQPRM
jgi:hypothetical protein